MKTEQNIAKLAAGVLMLGLLFTAAGCSTSNTEAAATAVWEPAALPTEIVVLATEASAEASDSAADVGLPSVSAASVPSLEAPTSTPVVSQQSSDAFQYAAVPAYSGEPYVVVNSNVPYFDEEQITAVGTERYSSLDALGRCGPAWASIGLELMPQSERGDISSVTPSGWNQTQVDGDWLYNRCHLIGYQLTAEDARPQNLITGTRYLNIQGMLPFENMVADYVKETGSHVMYRATPVFEDDELVCRGVLMEGLSVEDGGQDVSFCVFAYNVQPGVELSYADGSVLSSALPVAGADSESGKQLQTEAPAQDPTQEPAAAPVSSSYIGNKNTGKFHRSECSSVDDMKESNKVPFTSAAEALADGYVPCKRCKP